MLMCMSRITCYSQLRVGMDFWYVHGLGAGSFMTKYTVTGEPYRRPLGVTYEPNGSWYVPTSHVLSNGKVYEEGCFLSDAGICGTQYNNHQCFFDEEAARCYMENQILLAVNYKAIDYGFYMDDCDSYEDRYDEYDYDDYYDRDMYDDYNEPDVTEEDNIYCDGCGRSHELCDCHDL